MADNYTDPVADDPANQSRTSTAPSSAPAANPATGDAANQAQLDAKEAQRRKEQIEKEAALANKIRLNEQAALLMNIDLLRENTPTNEKIARKDKEYNNFCLFKGKGRDGHIELTKFLYKNPSNANFFDKVNNKMLSLLVPNIKLYKTFFPNESASRKPHQDCFMWRIPFDDISTNYGKETSQILNTSYGEGDSSKSIGVLDELLAGTGRMHGVGIKSFRYKYQGTNPAEINTNIEAELELYFQDIRDLLKLIEIPKDHANFVPIDPKPQRNFTFCYADLVADTPRMNREKKTGKYVYNPEYFRLQAVVGYSPIAASALQNLEEEEKQNLINVVKNSRVILYLTPYKHDLQFQENGTATLKITYSAALTSTMANIDALSITSLHDEVKKLQEKLDKERAEYTAEIDKAKKAEGITAAELEKHLQSIKEQTEIALKLAEEKVDNAKNLVYSEVFKRLVGLKQNRAGPNNGKVYSVLMYKEALGVDDPSKADENNMKKIESYKMDSILISDRDARLAANPDEIKKKTKTSKDSDSTASAAVDKEEERTEFNISNGKYLVKFVFLGDILDILCESTQEIGPLEKPRIILNDVTINIPRIISKKGAKQTGNQHNNILEPSDYQINIADIPISINLLQQFFFEKIIKKRIQNYPLNILLSDLISAIIAPATSPKIVGKSTIKKSLRISTAHICLPFSNGDTDSITLKAKEQPFSGILKPEKINENPPYLCEINGGLFGSYLIFYSSNHTPDILKTEGGTDESDTRLGIYKLRIGTDSGMVKRMNFSKTDQPFRREAKVLGSRGETNILRLKEVYDCSIVMFGNNFFRPGDFLYVEPMFFTGKSATDLQDKLGIGGYYQVIDVDSNINNGSFETSLKTVFTAWRDPESNKVFDDDGSK